VVTAEIRSVEQAAARVRQWRPALRETGERLAAAAGRAAGREAEAEPAAAFLFVCADRLRELALRVSRGARALPELAAVPRDAAEYRDWLWQMEQGAARAGAQVAGLEEISLAASLLALETSMRLEGGRGLAASLSPEIVLLAEELSLEWAGLRAAAAELAWAARDAGRWTGNTVGGEDR